MNATIDEITLFRTKRLGRKLTPDECVAIALFRRRDIRVQVLMRAFGVCRNSIYNKALTGGSTDDGLAKETHDLIEKIGVRRAWNEFVTQDMIDRVNRENKVEANARLHRLEARREARRAVQQAAAE
jgi:hypothetical protein